MQRIDRRPTAKTAGRVQALTQANACRIRGEQRRHTLARSPTHTLVQSECSARTCDFECNHSDEITLQPALDHLTQKHTHPHLHTHLSLLYISRRPPSAALRCGLTHACPASLDSSTISKLIRTLPPTSDCGAVKPAYAPIHKKKADDPQKILPLGKSGRPGTYIHHNDYKITTRQLQTAAFSLERKLTTRELFTSASNSNRTPWHYHNDTKEPPAAAQSQQRPPSVTMRTQSPPARPRRPSPSSSHWW